MIMIELSRASFDCLLDHASEALSQLFNQRAKDDESGYESLGSQVNIFCTDEQTKELLAIAEKDCTGAISAIKTGIRVGDEAIWRDQFDHGGKSFIFTSRHAL